MECILTGIYLLAQSFVLYCLRIFAVLFCISAYILHPCCQIAEMSWLIFTISSSGIGQNKMITQFLELWIPIIFGSVYFSWLLQGSRSLNFYHRYGHICDPWPLSMVINSKLLFFIFFWKPTQKIEKNLEFIYESNKPSGIRNIKYIFLPLCFCYYKFKNPAW